MHVACFVAGSKYILKIRMLSAAFWQTSRSLGKVLLSNFLHGVYSVLKIHFIMDTVLTM